MGYRAEGFRRSRAVGVLMLLLALSFLSERGMAQQDASIVGQLVDLSGAVLPGVTVTATSPALQTGSVVAITDERGEYRLTPLPIGTYDVTYSLQSFETVKREGIRLTVGFSAKLDVKLPLSGVQETATVVGSSPVVDVASTSTSTQLTHETIELIPTSRNGIIGLMQQAPGVRPNIDVGGNTINAVPVFHAFGQDGESWQMIEGLPAVSPKSGTQSNQFWDYNALEEANIETVGHNADIPTRGVAVNAIIKSGGNNFSGELFGAQTKQAFESNNITPALAAAGITEGNPIKTRYDYSATLGGPIKRDKLWFFWAGRRRYDVTLSDALPGTLPSGASSAELPNGALYSTEKLSYQINKSNQVTGYAMWTRKDDYSGLNQFTDYNSRSRQVNDGWNSKANWQSVRSDSLITNVGFGVWGFYSTYYGFSDQPTAVDQLSHITTGTSLDTGDTPLERRYHWDASISKYKKDLLGGDHSFKLGGEYNAERGDRPYVSRGAAGNTELIYRNGVPFELGVFNYPVTPYDKRHYLDVYAEDAWTIGRRVTLNIGARYAHDAGFVPGQCRDAAEGPAAITFPAACYPEVDFNVWNSIVPRVHASWDVTGDGKTSISGGWGRYAHMRMVDELQLANPLSASEALYKWHDLNGNGQYDPGEVNLAPNGSDFVSTNLRGGGPPSNGVANPSEREPMTDEITLALQRELTRGVALRITGVYSKNTNVYRLLNILRPYSAYSIPITRPDPGPDGKVGTADDPGSNLTYYDYSAQYAGAQFQQATLINDPTADSTYKSFEVAISKRLSKWMFMTSFSATHTYNPYINSTAGGLSLGINEVNPNAEIFAVQDTWESLGRATGSYFLPAGFMVSADFESRSGAPFARTVSLSGGTQIPSLVVRAEPLGSQNYPTINLLNLRLEKSISLGSRRAIAARINIYNATNASTATSLVTQSGSTYLNPTAILPPRLAELSLSFKY